MLAADALVVQPCSELESPGVSGGSLQLLSSVSPAASLMKGQIPPLAIY